MKENPRQGGIRLTRRGDDRVGSRPVVSVVLASYNCVDVIESALTSIFNQTFPDKELIVVDGGSTDGTVALLEKYDDRIDYWLSEEDKGIYDALNKGVALARGEWLYFLGSDDRLHDPGVFETVFSKPRTGKLIYGNVILSGNGPVGADGAIYDDRFTKLKLCYKNICQQAAFYHGTLFEALGPFNLDYAALADREFNIKVFAKYEPETCYIEDVVAEYNTEGVSSIPSKDDLEHELPHIVRRELGLRYFLHLKCSRFYKRAKGALRYRLAKVMGLVGKRS